MEGIKEVLITIDLDETNGNWHISSFWFFRRGLLLRLLIYMDNRRILESK